jgi:hypothetical protein
MEETDKVGCDPIVPRIGGATDVEVTKRKVRTTLNVFEENEPPGTALVSNDCPVFVQFQACPSYVHVGVWG